MAIDKISASKLCKKAKCNNKMCRLKSDKQKEDIGYRKKCITGYASQKENKEIKAKNSLATNAFVLW